MNFACLTTIAPGNTLAEQCQAIAAAGCTGVETIVFPEMQLERWVREMQQATTANGLVPAVTILGGLALYTAGQVPWLVEALAAVAELGGAALITPEYRAQDPLPLFPPFSQPSAAEREQVTDAVAATLEAAAGLDVTLLLEPVTQFEGRFWRTVADATTLCEAMACHAHVDHAGVVIDFHNMNVTEADPVAAIMCAGRWIKHVHLADSNRLLPGEGHIDFAAGLHALEAVGYRGWYTFECAVQAEFIPSVSATLARLHNLAGME